MRCRLQAGRWSRSPIPTFSPRAAERVSSDRHAIRQLDDRVEGAVFAITVEELAAADAYEVSDYERVEADTGVQAFAA